jgi:hypothetical protein
MCATSPPRCASPGGEGELGTVLWVAKRWYFPIASGSSFGLCVFPGAISSLVAFRIFERFISCVLVCCGGTPLPHPLGTFYPTPWVKSTQGVGLEMLWGYSSTQGLGYFIPHPLGKKYPGGGVGNVESILRCLVATLWAFIREFNKDVSRN